MFDRDQDSQRMLRAIVAERTRPVIAWVGSGLSAEAGLPTWKQLKDDLVKVLYQKAFSIQDGTRLVEIADQIQSEDDYWVSFQRLRDSLGLTTYRDCIREALGPAVVASIPTAYKILWQLPIRGVLTLNLDRMATRAYAFANPGRTPIEFNGSQVGRLLREIHGHRHIIANLHGIAEDTETWVFTHDELRALKRQAAYKDFIRVVLSSCTNIFLGMSVDDVAIGGYLQDLTNEGVETPSHFWVTARTDMRTDAWAERVGVRLIRYAVRNRSHRELIDILTDLRGSSPSEPETAPPVALTADVVGDSLPEVNELQAWPTDRVRRALNKRATAILAPESQDAYEEFNHFVDEYDEAIHRAWYTSTKDGRNELLGYILKEQVATGAFGKVYRAVDASGRDVAVKVLLEEVRRNPDLLQSFRRGVRSMRILQTSGISGMAAYEEASEIPAFVTMAWIEGPNLSQAKQAHCLEDWDTVLNVTKDLTGIIKSAHALPQRVLHRDIRPANVMLRDYWTAGERFEVVVLDFDLSWHRDSHEKSVVHTSAVGYLAPEQLQEKHDGSTRNAAVDAFGIGMTLYFMCGGIEPMPELHKHADYEQLVYQATSKISSSPWLSLPKRVARLILGATRDKQSERWDLSQIHSELGSLLALHLGDTYRASMPQLVEELAANVEPLSRYTWDDDRSSADTHLPTGLTYRLTADEPRDLAVFDVAWRSTGAENRTGMAKYIGRATRTLGGELRAQRWSVEEQVPEGQSMFLRATIERARLMSELPSVARRLSETLSSLKFSQ